MSKIKIDIDKFHKDIVVYEKVENIDKEVFTRLKGYSDIGIPRDYRDFVRTYRDLGLEIYEGEYLRLWGGSLCIEMNEALLVKEYIPKSLIIADDFGSRVLGYMTGNKGFGLYYTYSGGLDSEDAVYVAKTLKRLLYKGEGLERILD